LLRVISLVGKNYAGLLAVLVAGADAIQLSSQNGKTKKSQMFGNLGNVGNLEPSGCGKRLIANGEQHGCQEIHVRQCWVHPSGETELFGNLGNVGQVYEVSEVSEASEDRHAWQRRKIGARAPLRVPTLRLHLAVGGMVARIVTRKLTKTLATLAR
jgi:hypothetical protein